MRKPSVRPIGMWEYLSRMPASRKAMVHWSGRSLVVTGKSAEKPGGAARKGEEIVWGSCGTSGVVVVMVEVVVVRI